MKQTTQTIADISTLEVAHVGGDLQVVGWDRSEITAKADGKSLSLLAEGNLARAASESDLILYAPFETVLQVARVGGDADLRAISGGIEISTVNGDLQMRNVGSVAVQSVGGDLSVRDCKGDFVAEQIGGDASLHQMRGSVSVTAGDDLHLREAEGNVTAQIGSDAALYLRPKPGQTIYVQAGSDILLRVPPRVNASFSLQGSDDEAIRVDLPGFEAEDEPGAFQQFTIGAGEASISLTAGGEVIITSREDEWQSVADFDPLGHEGPFAPGEFPGISSEVQARISRQVEEATRRAMKASARAQEKSERVQQRVEAAMRRAEEKMRSAERRSTHTGFSFGRGGASFNIGTPRPSTPPSDPVTDDERLTILKMLQEKKISLQEAETLLTALEGK